MDYLVDLIRTRPVVVSGLLRAVLGVAVAFGLTLSDAQAAALVALAAAFVSLLEPFATQKFTNSKHFVDENLRDAEQAIKSAVRSGDV